MNKMKLIKERHSVRKYLDKPIEQEKVNQIKEEIYRINEEAGLSISYTNTQGGSLGSIGLKMIGWRNVQGAIILAGPSGADLDERCGYWGEHLVLLCQDLGLNTCWAGMAKEQSFDINLPDGCEYVIAIGVGYGANQGKPHKSKRFDQVTKLDKDAPDWFVSGVESALLAPTAVNQQKFTFELLPDDQVRATAPKGNLTLVDLGIVAYHFEAATGVKVTLG